MDLVKIGFLVKADGLKDANTQMDALLDKADKLGSTAKQSAKEFDDSQKKVASSSKVATKEVDLTTKALEKQRLIGDYLGKGLDRSTATTIAGFKQMGASAQQVNDQIAQLLQNKGLDQTRKDLDKLTVQQEKQAKAVSNTVSQYERLSSKSLGGGVLDTVEKQNKGLEELTNHYRQIEKQQQLASQAQQKALDKELASTKRVNQERQKALSIEQQRQKYIEGGYSKTDATRLARLEVSGADVATLNNYKKAIDATNQSLSALSPVTNKATEAQGKFFASVKGIAIYAALSAAIYGAMTATINLGTATVKLADEYIGTQQRLKLYIKDAETLAQVNTFLTKTAIENNVGLRENAQLYTKLSPVMQQLGANTQATNTVVDAFGKALRIGGATATEAASATLQFAQAMASGKLAGDEFRSIAEASPRFLKAIADGSGIAAGKLKEMSSQGMLTSEFITKALINQSSVLKKEAQALGYTLDMGANAIVTGFTAMVGAFNEGAGATKTIGEYMVDLGTWMGNSATSAKDLGKSVSDNFKAMLPVINVVVEAVKALAIVLASRYAVSIALAIRESIRYQATLASMAAQEANVTRLSLILSTAITGVGNAMKGALEFFGGWVGLLATVATATVSYLALSDATDKHNKSLMDEGKTIQEAVQAYKDLTEVQQKKALADEKLKGTELAKEFENQKQALVTNTLNMSRHVDMTDTQAQSFGKLALAYKQGNITLEQLTKTVTNSTVLTEAQKKKFLDLASGVDKASGDTKTHDQLVRQLTGGMSGLGNEAIITGQKISAFSQSMKDLESKYKSILAIRKSTGLDDFFAGKAYEEGLTQVASDSQIIKAQQAQAKFLDSINAKRAKGLDVTKEMQLYEANNVKLAEAKNNKALAYAKIVAPQAKLAQQAQEANSNYTQSMKDQAKEADKTAKANAKIVEKYEVQEATALRLTRYLKDGVGYSVAKKASEEKYNKVFGNNLTIAEKIVKAERELAELESKAKGREDSAFALKSQLRDYHLIIGFMKEGLSLSVAQQSVQSGWSANVSGIEYANARLLQIMQDQLMTSEAEIMNQQDLLDFVKSGLSVEEASAKVAIYRNKNLNQGLIAVSDALALAEKEKAIAIARLSLEQDSNNLKRESSNLVATQKNDLAEILTQYQGIGLEEAKRLKAQQNIVEKLKQYNDMLEDQRTLVYAINSVDFDVFGDFGDPFKSSLEGLNKMLFSVDDLKAKYVDMFSAIDAGLSKAVVGSAEYTSLTAQRQNLEKMQEAEIAQMRDNAIASGLGLAKSLFKENSKGYKAISALEKTYQAQKIAFALWEKKDAIQMLAVKIGGYAQDAIAFVTGTATKIAAQMGLNVAQAQGAVAASANAPPPVGFASAAAMIALLAGIGISLGGGSSGSFAPSNTGTGTVFGDDKAQSESIKNSIDLLADNSDMLLPLTNSMLKSLKNIEGSIAGVTNLYLRQAIGGASITDGFTQSAIGKGIESSIGLLNKATFGLADTLTLGLFSSVGKLLGGLFGSKTTVKGQGLFGGSQNLGSIIGKGFDLQEYVDVQIKKKTFGVTTSTKNKTKYSEADKALEKQFTMIFTGFYDTILNASTSLGGDLETVKKNLENAVVNIGKIDLKGLKGTEIQEKLEAVFGSAADSLAQQGFKGLDDFQKVGEGYYETLIRVATGVEQATYYTDKLNVTAIKYTDILNKQGDVATEIIRQSVLLNDSTKNIKGGFYDLVNTFNGSAEELFGFINQLKDLQDQLIMTGKDASYLTQSMILGAGGLDQLQSGFDAYFEMLSPAEQAAELTRRLTNEFAVFGKELPSDVKAFRNLVNSIDLSTEAGQKLYGQIIALAPEFNDLQDALKNANSDVNALVQSLRDLAEQARKARGETEQPRNYASTRSQFQSDAVLAMAGDTEAAKRLVTLGGDLLSLSKMYSTSSEQYAADLALIQRAATVAADLQEKGLGLETSLTPPSGGTEGTPTVNTDTTTTDQRLDLLSEKLEAGLFAIAKYTQDSADRLARWDYGDRLLVCVGQDVTGDPIPVKITT